jgi:transcription elongation factor Elf1
MSIPFRLISRWLEKDLTCARCGETRSVKYEMNGKTYCNICILSLSIRKEDSHERD